MVGIKGRSGRRPSRDEDVKHAVIKKAWLLMHEKMYSTDRDRQAYAKDFAVKDMTTHVDSTVDMHAHVTQEERNALEQYITKNRLAQN